MHRSANSVTIVPVRDKIDKDAKPAFSTFNLRMPSFLIRIGSLAELYIGQSTGSLERGQRVIVRTDRGVEMAETVAPLSPRQIDNSVYARATILRTTTNEDELLIRRLDRHKREAVEACRRMLTAAGSTATLLDVDQLFDGGTLVMHFLGPVDEIAESVTRQVVQQYESVVRSRHFAKLLVDGCGPNCGTSEGQGCSSKCAGCAVSCL